MQLNRPSLLSRSCLSVALAASVLCSVQAQSAGEPQTLISNGDVRITTLDMQADALRRIPEDKRGEVLSNPQNVEQIARGLYLFRMLAQEFEKQPQASQPEIQAALRQVRERFLAESKRDPQPELRIRADLDTRYEILAQVMASARSGGMKRIGFITRPGQDSVSPKPGNESERSTAGAAGEFAAAKHDH